MSSRPWSLVPSMARIVAVVAAFGGAPVHAAESDVQEFTVMAYNVEMLFDVDGVALLDDYQPGTWGPAQLARKLDGVSRVLQRVDGALGRGPDIICFNELEADQTPESSVTDMDAFLAAWKHRRAADLLRSGNLEPGLAQLPAHAWLAKQLADDGMTGYQVAIGQWRNDPTGHLVFHTNAIFSRFPIVATRTHPTNGARGILEVEIQFGDRRLHVFNNHWKSGASDASTEPIRIGNAEVLRKRLKQILRKDPLADVILAGDFNSQYNQKQRYRDMPRTAMNDVLRSQGDEQDVATLRGPDLYNLWFELPIELRGSDEYHDEWGTLMHILISRGLYDQRGVQYVDNSFAVAAFPGLNAQPDTGRPVRWTFAAGGAGFSDHFPIMARFRAGIVLPPVELVNPSRTTTGPGTATKVALRLEHAADLSNWPRDQEFRSPENLGKFFRARGRITSRQPLRAQIAGVDVDIAVWIHDRAKREQFIASHAVGENISFVGELGQFRGEWQLVIPASTLP